MIVRGEILANEEGGAPRLMIDLVPPADAVAEVANCKVSLMLLSAVNDGRPTNLGRWDFGPDYVRAAVVDDSNSPTLRFFVELPDDVNPNQPTELWARFVPQNGAKLLAHSKVDLTQPSTFTSLPAGGPPKQEKVVVASYEEAVAALPVPTSPVPPTPDTTTASSAEDKMSTSTSAPLVESSWAVAAPGLPANLPTLAETGGEGGGWKTSTQPMPPVVQQASSERDRTSSLRDSLRRLASQTSNRPTRPAAESKPAVRPAWSPERGGHSEGRIASRPNWSATR
jgi:hypothetical protein